MAVNEADIKPGRPCPYCEKSTIIEVKGGAFKCMSIIQIAKVVGLFNDTKETEWAEMDHTHQLADLPRHRGYTRSYSWAKHKPVIVETENEFGEISP